MTIPLPPLMARTEFLDHANLPPKLLALNSWLLDKQGEYQNASRRAQVTQGDFFKAEPLNKGIDAPDGTAAGELARTAVSMIDSQIFRDANHRTAVLALFEYLASVGVLVTRNAIRIYWIVAVRNGRTPEQVIATLKEEVRRNHYKPAGGVTAAHRALYTSEVKATETVWPQIHAMHARIQAGKTTEERRKIAREEKRLHPVIYALYLELYPNPID